MPVTPRRRHDLSPFLHKKAEAVATVAALEQLGHGLTQEDVERHVACVSKAQDLVKLVDSCAALGFGTVILHNTGPNQEDFIRVVGDDVLPILRGATT